MTEYQDILGRPRSARQPAAQLRLPILIAAALIAILFQVYVPLFFEYLGYLELPLLVTVYLALMRRQPAAGVACGAIIGLVQDSLSHHPLGMFGLVKTLVGYFAASVSLRLDVDNPVMRLILAFFFFLFHQVFFWVLTRALLGNPVDLAAGQTFMQGVMNAMVAVPMFHLLDKLRDRG